MWRCFRSHVSQLTLISIFVGNTSYAALRSETNAAFDRYLHNLDQRRTEQQQSGCHLWIDCSPDLKRRALAGEIVVKPITAVLPCTDLRVPGGEIHDTVGAMFLKGENIDAVRGVLDDYAHFPRIYGPEIVSATVKANGKADPEVLVRVRKHFVITVVLDILCRDHWTTPDAAHAIEHTTAIHIGEAKDPDRPDAGERTPEQDRGFLWRYESYWRIEKIEDGLLIEHEIISLSRRAPASLQFILRPLLKRLPQESMSRSLLATRRAVLERPKGGTVSLRH